MRKPAPSLKNKLCLLWLMLSPLAWCATDHEREELSRLLKELQYLDRIVDVARQSANQSDHYRFDYDALEGDLTRIEAGIAGYLNEERREPRVLEPIDGDFTDGR